MSYNSHALLIIDVQESFRHRDYYQEHYLPDFIDNIQKLITAAKQEGIKLVQIFHTEPEGVFSKSSGFVKTLSPITITPDLVIEKTRHSAFAGTALDIWLKENGINELTICGIRTEQCCETTTRHASDIGYKVNYVTDATLTFDMQHPDDSSLSADQIKHRTETVLSKRFATIRSLDDAISHFGD
ncbi:cysteine hydrolase family protein [Maritalea myrionectae]|uniref:cysteine hydrolase family protein n=1 Tax=Maritalea myrionectae TaxID=454601 RepID=UPI0004013E33|nr:cysteine hydrolase family protein [Maritalea myrionectae]